MSKTFTCKELGGACDEKFSGETFMEILGKGMNHMSSDPAHKEKVANLSNETLESKEEWFARMQKEFEVRENDN